MTKAAKTPPKGAEEPAEREKRGRPSDYSLELAAVICERLIEGESLRSICRDAGMPSASTVCLWLTKHTDFSELYTRAREAQGDTLADDILEIADNATNDWMEKLGENGETLGWRENGEAIRRSQLRVDARKWLASKLKPRKYGEKITAEHTGEIAHVHTDDPDGARNHIKRFMENELARVAKGEIPTIQ